MELLTRLVEEVVDHLSASLHDERFGGRDCPGGRRECQDGSHGFRKHAKRDSIRVSVFCLSFSEASRLLGREELDSSNA